MPNKIQETRLTIPCNTMILVVSNINPDIYIYMYMIYIYICIELLATYKTDGFGTRS